MINKPIELHGLLALIRKPEQARSNNDAITVERQADTQIQESITAENFDGNVGKFAWVLDPASYEYYTRWRPWPEPDANKHTCSFYRTLSKVRTKLQAKVI